MGALSADVERLEKDGKEIPAKVYRSTHIYGGALVCWNAAGYLVPGADTSGLIFAGISQQNVNNAAAVDGAETCTIKRRGLVLATFATAITIANVGDNVFLVDDNTVDLVANVSNAIFCGIIAEYVDTTHAWIDIEPAIRQADVATHIADTSGAHAASAISIADSGAHFSAAEGNVEAALAKLSKTIIMTFSAATIATAASDAKIVDNMEFPVPVRIKRAYATLGTAPGSGKTLTIEAKIAAGADAELCTVTGTNTTGAAEDLDIAVPADTAFDIQLTQDTGSAAGLNLVIVAEVDDGE